MRRDRVAGAALAAQSVSFGLNFTAGVFFTPVSAAYGLTATTLAIAAGLATAVTGPAQPVVGVLLDRLGARFVLLTGLTLISGSYLALAAVRETWQFVAAYVLLGGLGFAASSSLAVTTLIGRAYGDRAGPALTRASVGINLGQLLAPWAATALFEPVGVRGAYLALGLTGLVVTIVLAGVLPPDRGPVRAPSGTVALRGKGRVLASFGLHSATLYVLILLLPKYATELGWSAVRAGRLVAVSAVAAGITALVIARLLGRYPPETLLRALHLVRAVSLLLAATATDPRALLAVAVIFGTASFTVIPLTMALLTRDLDRTRLGRALAPAWLIHQVSAGFALAVAAAVHAQTGSYRGYFAFGVLLSLTAAALVGRPAPIPTLRKESAR
ncbi:MFS transporter [Thermomonospora umbrina]|uniref:Putative MFS family arabinose efflux permease n=1 Tax=Thermomonospora umbrina TaxID=111806 RepID=A0A3D9SYN8_9ACTN|nr:MFS transporter [Thermomonospora umbrina]REE96731.1 putative MFS family arabinose efflux permease [Thermomonospora umbrina]